MLVIGIVNGKAGTLIYLVVFSLFGLYNRLWQYASINELLSILYAVTVGTSSVVLIIYFLAAPCASSDGYCKMEFRSAYCRHSEAGVDWSGRCRGFRNPRIEE